MTSKVQEMVSFFEKKGSQTVASDIDGRRRSMTAMMNFTGRPWEHIPRRKSSSSTNSWRKSSSSMTFRRRSSTSTGSESTTYDLAERQLGDSFYATSERSGTSTAISEGRRRSINPDYDWEHEGFHDEIDDLKASLNNISLSSSTADIHLKKSDSSSELRKRDSASSVESRWGGLESPGVHEIDFVDALETQSEESRSRSAKRKSLTHHQPVNEELEVLKEEADEGERVDNAMDLDTPDAAAGSSQQSAGDDKVPAQNSAEQEVPKTEQLRLKTTQLDVERPFLEVNSPTSPTSPSPKTKTRPKLALELPGIPETEAETPGRRRRSPLSRPRRPPALSQGANSKFTSRPPVSLRRYPMMRSLSAPQVPTHEGEESTSPTQMMDLVNQRQMKFNKIREEKLRRLSSTDSSRSVHRSHGLMGRRHASAPVTDAASQKTGVGQSPLSQRPAPRKRPSLSQRLSLSKRKRSVSQAIRNYIQSPRRRSTILFWRRRSVAA
ncbi:hypothetical protein diail_3415 [Diaporthe ilicicola]|nr:hypothetical protein diail_3415 [Diaporthe ilicicola]